MFLALVGWEIYFGAKPKIEQWLVLFLWPCNINQELHDLSSVQREVDACYNIKYSFFVILLSVRLYWTIGWHLVKLALVKYHELYQLWCSLEFYHTIVAIEECAAIIKPNSCARLWWEWFNQEMTNLLYLINFLLSIVVSFVELWALSPIYSIILWLHDNTELNLYNIILVEESA